MLSVLGWVLIIFPGILFIGQVISTINFRLAQRLGLQENPEHADKLVTRAERYVAYWDLVTLVWMPVAGVLMVLEHNSWPLVGFFASAIYLDTSGREAAKILSFKHEGLRLGSENQHRFFMVTYLIMAVLGLVVLSYSGLDLLGVL
ncbi:MAG: hypothetical protein U9N57_08770 [Pseudomonadota bacterium]|nr:hypothetical protein [Pseudomonadota bacterium]